MYPNQARNHDDPRDGDDELIALVKAWREGFASADPELLTGLWASDDEGLVYVAGERARALRTREEIARYYHDALGMVESVDTADLADLSATAEGTLGRAFFTFHFAGRDSASGDHFDVDIRATINARRRDGGWRLVHYHESAPGPL